MKLLGNILLAPVFAVALVLHGILLLVGMLFCVMKSVMMAGRGR